MSDHPRMREAKTELRQPVAVSRDRVLETLRRLGSGSDAEVSARDLAAMLGAGAREDSAAAVLRHLWRSGLATRRQVWREGVNPHAPGDYKGYARLVWVYRASPVDPGPDSA